MLQREFPMWIVYWNRREDASVVAFCDGFNHCFRLRTQNVLVHSKQYLSGLMQARKKNREWIPRTSSS